MNPPELTLPLLSALLNEILGERECVNIRDFRIAELVRLLDSDEKYWHITQENALWRADNWRRSQERLATQKQQWREENERIEARKQGYYSLIAAVARNLGGREDDKLVRELAHSILIGRKAQLAALFGVDLDKIPVLEKPYLILGGEKGEYVEL